MPLYPGLKNLTDHEGKDEETDHLDSVMSPDDCSWPSGQAPWKRRHMSYNTELLNRQRQGSLIAQGCTWISLQTLHPLEEEENQGVVNFPIQFSSKALILKPLMVTSPSPLCNWLSSHGRLHCTFPYLTPFSL